MIHSRLLLLMTCAAVLAACETAPEPDAAAAIERAKPVVQVSVDTEAPDPGALGSYSIPSGRCGMVLWARAGTETVPIFQALDDGNGLMEIDGRRTGLSRQSVRGQARAKMPQIQEFSAHSADGSLITVEAVTVWGTSFPGGSYVERGTLTLTGADGWQRVMPVAGIAGCKA